MSIFILQAYSDSPEFKTTYKSTEKTLEVEFSHLEVLLHEQALLTVIAFAKNLGNKVVALSSNTLPVADELSTGRTRHNSHSSNVSDVMEYIGKQATKTGNLFIYFALYYYLHYIIYVIFSFGCCKLLAKIPIYSNRSEIDSF